MKSPQRAESPSRLSSLRNALRGPDLITRLAYAVHPWRMEWFGPRAPPEWWQCAGVARHMLKLQAVEVVPLPQTPCFSVRSVLRCVVDVPDSDVLFDVKVFSNKPEGEVEKKIVILWANFLSGVSQ